MYICSDVEYSRCLFVFFCARGRKLRTYNIIPIIIPVRDVLHTYIYIIIYYYDVLFILCVHNLLPRSEYFMCIDR